MRRVARNIAWLLGSALLIPAGCVVDFGPPQIQAEILDGAWTPDGVAPGARGWKWEDQDARVSVWIWARDPYAPLGITVSDPGGGALEFRLVVNGASPQAADAPARRRIGIYRRVDAAARFTPDRLPHGSHDADVVAVPSGGSAQVSLLGEPLSGHQLPEGEDRISLDIDVRRSGPRQPRPFRCRNDRVIGTMGLRMAGH